MSSERKHIIIALVVSLLTLTAYLPAVFCGFINWDDQDYILNNPAIRNLDWNLVKSSFTPQLLTWWVPLTSISFGIDYFFWGLNPAGFHLTNIILHAVNAGLVVLITDSLIKHVSGRERLAEMLRGDNVFILLVAGLVFSIHPLRVESVAWVTERKDVLSGLFVLASLYQYLRYAEIRSAGQRGTSHYIASLLLFTCSLAAKPVSVILTPILLIADWYPLGRISRRSIVSVMLEKIPYVAGSAGLSLLMLFSAIKSEQLVIGLSAVDRIIISGNALFEYMKMFVWPVGIIPLYFIPSQIPDSYVIKAILFTIIFFCAIAVGMRRQWFMAAWLCYLIPFLPVLALTQNGIQSLAVRFTYLPAVFLSMTLAILLGVFLDRVGGGYKSVASGLVVILLFFCVAGTYRSLGVWKNSGTFWSRVIDYQPFDRAYFYRALYYVDEGNFPAAISDYSTALKIAAMESMREIYNLYAFRGEALYRAGRYEDAVSDFNTAISISAHPLYFRYRGLALRKLGRVGEAEADLARAGESNGQMYWFEN